jgi:hypothetical protein
MKYILTNLKSFAAKNTLIFLLFILCEIADVLIILFSHGAFQNFKASKDLEKQKDNVLGYSFCFGEIVDTVKDEKGDDMYYIGSEAITPTQLEEVLDRLDDKTKASLPGMYFTLSFDDDEAAYAEYFDTDEDGDVNYPMSAVRIEYDEDLGDYSLYNSYVENISLRKGRYFTKEEYASDENLIVLPSYAKDELIGKTVRLLGKDYTVIGILGENASDEFQVPFKTLDDSCSVSDISLLDDNALDVQSFAKLKKAFAEVLDCDVNFPPVETVDLSEIKFYNSIIFMSVAVAVASAVNLAMLFRYVIKSRNKQTAVFLLCGCTRGKIRRMYTAEIGIISVSIYGVFAAVFNYALLPLLKVFFEYIEVAYNPRVYLTIFGIYIVSIYLFLNIVILRTSKASPVKMLKERGR